MAEHVETPQDFQPYQELLARIPTMGRAALEAEYIRVLGRKQGELTEFLRVKLPQLPLAEKRVAGAEANRWRAALEAAFQERRKHLEAEEAMRATADTDLTMPGRRRWRGAVHPVAQVEAEIVDIFRTLGFVRAVGPEAETEWYNFGALNFPADHPAMDMHDTLYLDVGERRSGRDRRHNRTSGVMDEHERRETSERRAPAEGRVLLRTHTSPVQIRTMLAEQPPIRVVIPGVVYRKDAFDASHSPVFGQVEGLAVDEGISFVDLKATLTHFAQALFGSSTKVRFRPSFFPFTEPSADMEISCRICGGVGCPACKGTGWMEILGSGMVHPKVLEHCGIDSERYTGFAFGLGTHRLAMQRFGVPDIRLLFEADMRFLGQFAGVPNARRAGSARPA